LSLKKNLIVAGQPNLYPHSNTNGKPEINQIWVLKFSISQTGENYSQEVGVHYLSPDFSRLGMVADTSAHIPLSSTTKNIIKMISNEDYFVVHHQLEQNSRMTQHDVYSKKTKALVFSVSSSLEQAFQAGYGKNVILHGKYFLLPRIGAYTIGRTKSFAGYVEVYDMELGVKVQTLYSPSKNDSGFGVAVSAHGNMIAISSQKIPFKMIDPYDEKKPKNFSGRVHLYDVSNWNTPKFVRTISNSSSGFGTCLAMNASHIYISAPHAHVTYKNPQTRKNSKAIYSGAVYCYSLTDRKFMKPIFMPLPFPLAEFGHTMSLQNKDLCIACERNIFLQILNPDESSMVRQGFAFDVNTYQLKSMLSFPNYRSVVSEGGQFFVGNEFYSVETANYVARLESDTFFFFKVVSLIVSRLRVSLDGIRDIRMFFNRDHWR
jgi:hypothetical protein